VALVLLGHYATFERVMRWLVGVLFLALVGAALAVAPPLATGREVVAAAGVPDGGAGLALGVLGGVGGSVTLLSYGYWIRERGWNGPAWLSMVRFDLAAAYGVVGLFGVAVTVLGAVVLHPTRVEIEGPMGVVTMADLLGAVLGRLGRATFLVGFWATVATSMLGVWQSVPHLLCDVVDLSRRRAPRARGDVNARSARYRWFLIALATVPAVLLFQSRPVGVVLVYSVVGALFLPFLAATLLWLNRAKGVEAELRSRLPGQVLLAACLALFVYLGWVEIRDALGG
jgi:Mn2+/Fe2+ NRAMP family transporter